MANTCKRGCFITSSGFIDNFIAREIICWPRIGDKRPGDERHGEGVPSTTDCSKDDPVTNEILVTINPGTLFIYSKETNVGPLP